MKYALALAILLAATPAIAECGIASMYGIGRSEGGPYAANGERLVEGMTAAHKHLPFGTRVRVRNQRTGRSIVVRINDRGPFVGGRIIDLTHLGMRAIGGGGLVPVCIEVVGRGRRR